jgi:MoaA/NifB/PqqE/SkfB family radical SAM enzyme
MQLVMVVTARCNASCEHCSTSCGPKRQEHLSREMLERLIDEAAALSKGEPLEISITGGEPFLDFPLLKHVVQYGRARGATMSCVSNGYWATSPARADDLLRQLKDSGLAILAISTSKFHQRFVSRTRVDRALDAARRIGVETVLKYVRTSDDADVDAICASGDSAGADRTEVIPLMPTLRDDARLADGAYAREPGIPAGTCPGAIVSVREDGNAYPCCTPGGFNGFFRLGNVADASLREIQERFYLSPKLQVLRAHGPAFFAKAIRERGLQERLRPAYAGVCDLCTHIASDPQMAAVAEQASQDFVLEQLGALLSPRSSPTPATTE